MRCIGPDQQLAPIGAGIDSETAAGAICATGPTPPCPVQLMYALRGAYPARNASIERDAPSIEHGATSTPAEQNGAQQPLRPNRTRRNGSSHPNLDHRRMGTAMARPAPMIC
jgi:hypothetical protein